MSTAEPRTDAFILGCMKLDSVQVGQGDVALVVTRGLPIDDASGFVSTNDILELADRVVISDVHAESIGHTPSGCTRGDKMLVRLTGETLRTVVDELEDDETVEEYIADAVRFRAAFADDRDHLDGTEEIEAIRE